jgi:hypothetical protein
MGMPTLSRMAFGAAPVPPRITVDGDDVGPARTMPLAMAAELCTAAIFTETGLV